MAYEAFCNHCGKENEYKYKSWAKKYCDRDCANKATAQQRKKKVEFIPIEPKTKSIREVPGWIEKLNDIGDLPPVHTNDPRLQDLRVALGEEPLVKEHASLMESYLRHKERRKMNVTEI